MYNQKGETNMTLPKQETLVQEIKSRIFFLSPAKFQFKAIE